MKIISKRHHGGVEELIKKIKKTKGATAVGVFKDSGDYEDGTSIVDVALINELGSPKRGIPKRSFLLSTATKQKSNIQKNLTKVIKNIIDGADPVKEKAKLGAWFSGEVTKTISNGGIPFVSNSEATIKAKGGNNTPLRNSTKLLKAVKWQVL